MKTALIKACAASLLLLLVFLVDSQVQPVARATMISSSNVALVPDAAGEGCCAGVMPTSGTVGGTSLSFDEFQFTDLPVGNVSAASLAAFDTLVLLQVEPSHFTLQQKADINSFVANGGKLIIYDSDAIVGVDDYTWLMYPFVTHPPCPNCGLFGGTLTIKENNTLSSTESASPYYINTAEIPPNTDAVGDANVFAAYDDGWFGDMDATNARGQYGWTHAYGEPASKEWVVIYNGIDTDYIGDTSWSPSGIDWLAKIWYLELKQQWEPTQLPEENPLPVCGNTVVEPPAEQCDPPQTNSSLCPQSNYCQAPYLCVRDAYGDCGAYCGCSYDAGSCICYVGQCGAQCATSADCPPGSSCSGCMCVASTPTPTPPPSGAVGGVAQLPDVSGSSDPPYAALGGGLAAAVLALTACASYIKRRRLR